jgi:predicted O-methyltransferase YrrM
MTTNQPLDPAPQGLRQLATRRAMRTLVRRPRWFFANLKQGPEFLRERRMDTGIDAFAEYVEPEDEAVAAALGVDRDAYATAIANLWMPEADPDEPLSTYNAREELLRLVGAIVRLVQPATMVETGVAFGYTTATVLRVMRENARGHLYSIDLPPLQYDPNEAIGRAVPDELKDRWTLRVGDSRKLLAPVAAEAAPIDIFLHDALHTYSAQLREYRTVWPKLRAGGVLISDDVANPAFVQFSNEVGAMPHLIVGPSRPSAVGLLRKE